MQNVRKKSLLNFDNDNNSSGFYPLFLGEDLGFADEINITYPEIDRIYKKQRSAYWLEDEFSFEQDRVDLLEAPEYERDVMVLNLLAQWALDSLASRSIIETFGPFISNNELHNWFLVQTYFESVHAATYSKIIRNCFVDGNDVLERGKKNLEVFGRCKSIAQVFQTLNRVGAEYTLGLFGRNEEEIRIIKGIILKGVAALYGLEQISFMSSFACTFALVESGRYQGIGKAVGSILADEAFHSEGDGIVFGSMFKESEYGAIFEENKADINTIFDDIVQQEYNWAEYVFSEGRKVLGLNEALLKEYAAWSSIQCYQTLGLEWDVERFGEQPKQNPLPFMDHYFDRDSIQNANQEIENNNYRVGQVEDDIMDDEIFDF